MLQFLGLASTQQADKLVQAAAFRIISPTIRASMRMSHLDATPSRADGQLGLAPVVYLVDDDPSFLRALSRRLQAAGYQVEAFGSAEQFLRRRRSEAPGCAVLDLRMPGPGGLGLQEALVKAEEPLPVIFLTGHGDVPSTVQAMKGGAVDFLLKPVEDDQLLEAIAGALRRHAAARADAAGREKARARWSRLTPRERQVCALVAR